MAVTTRLGDGSVGNTSTGETGAASASSSGTCGYLSPAAYLTAQSRLGTIHSVTGASWALRLTEALSGIGGTPCLSSFTSSSEASLTIEAYLSGAWVEVYSGSLTCPTIPVSLGDSNYIELTGSTTWDVVLSCDLRAIVAFSGEIWSITQSGTTHTTTILLTDLRFTATDTSVACSGSGGSGGDEDSGGGGGDSATDCVYTDDNSSSCSYSSDLDSCGSTAPRWHENNRLWLRNEF